MAVAAVDAVGAIGAVGAVGAAAGRHFRMCNTYPRGSISGCCYVHQGGDPFGSRGTTSSGAFDISALRPATGLGLERREASAAPKKAQEGEGSEFLGA